MRTDVMIIYGYESANMGDEALPLVGLRNPPTLKRHLEGMGTVIQEPLHDMSYSFRGVCPFLSLGDEPLDAMLTDVEWGTFDSLDIAEFVKHVELAGWRDYKAFMMLVRSENDTIPTIYRFAFPHDFISPKLIPYKLEPAI